jgi:hypothetical protein
MGTNCERRAHPLEMCCDLCKVYAFLSQVQRFAPNFVYFFLKEFYSSCEILIQNFKKKCIGKISFFNLFRRCQHIYLSWCIFGAHFHDE